MTGRWITYAAVLTSLQRMFICSKANNVLVWTASKTGIFTVKSCYSLLLEANEGQFPRNMVWNSCIPSFFFSFFFFCVGSLVEKGSNYGINLRKGGRHLTNRCLLLQKGGKY